MHPALFSSLDDIGRSQVKQLLRRLGVKRLSARDLINSHILPTFKSDKWKVRDPMLFILYFAPLPCEHRFLSCMAFSAYEVIRVACLSRICFVFSP